MDVNYQRPRRFRASAAQNPDCGYTLAELLVVLLVAGILLGTALPSFSGLLRAQRVTNQVNSLVADLNFARSEAIKSVQRVHLCKSPDLLDCNPDAKWSDGWIVFSDLNRNGLKDPEEPVLRARSRLPEGYSLTFRSFHAADYVRYYPDGHAPNTGTFVFCPPAGAEDAKAIIIFRGRLRSARVDGSGNALSCPG